MKKKIIFITPSLSGGGAERVIINIANNLDKKLFIVYIIVIYSKDVFSNLVDDKVKVIYLNKKKSRHSIIQLIKTLNKTQPNIIFASIGHINIILIFLKYFLKNKPKIILREPNTPSISLNKLSNYKRIFFKLLYKLFYPKATLIISQCKQMENDIINFYGINKIKIKTIYNPIDINYINKSIGSMSPFNNNYVNFLAIGRITYQKGFDILINAFVKVKNEIPNAHLTILGDGILLNQLKYLVKLNNIQEHVDFKGFVLNPYNYLYYCDVFVLSSRYEGFPNILLEALACKAKVVATDCMSGPREIIGENQYGFLVEVNNIDSLAQGMIRAYKTHNKSDARFLDFDIMKIIKEYELLFNRL